MLDNVLEQLHIYCDKLFFEIGGWPDRDQELIITADGDINYFERVEELINDAPEIKGWIFTAFIQPTDLDYASNFEDVDLKPFEMWFLPLDNKNNPKSIGLRICLPNYDSVKDSEWLEAAVYKVLNTVLGEKSFANDVDYIEIKHLPDGNPADQGMMELTDMAAFIKWKKAKLASL
ncbi:hypothetical protein [Mucilaginibacter sp. SP1R1]|uniref:hypothetical protein n=1 Tax=Mucilaginibacter sp. SP1R1 TaxID=2723091 RepID=UPI001612F540|nr:hypothetical protein [Mucilaginibacter sp. SP1R1]MBB6148468.1 hypothetical protein [Mucilaginibacter sp. SP1R1]